MHREFRKLLEQATGASRTVLVVNADVRDFSVFSTKVESSDIALYIKRLYIKLIDEYFSNAAFYKPTGDGLLVVIPYDEKTLQKTIAQTLRSCFRLLDKFGTLCTKDPMINFPVPQNIGIGLSRGSASCLMHEDKILDYFGRVLNLASRMMELARPSGIVFDDSFGLSLVPPASASHFAKTQVYIRGIAEQSPITIHYTKEHSVIDRERKHPIQDTRWGTKKLVYPFSALQKFESWFKVKLNSTPVDPKKINITVEYPAVRNGRKHPTLVSYFLFDKFEYVSEAGDSFVRIDYIGLARRLQKAKVKPNWEVSIQIVYQER